MKERAKSSEVCVTDREKGGEVVENKIIDSKEIQDTSCRSTHTHTHTRPRHIHTHTHTHDMTTLSFIRARKRIGGIRRRYSVQEGVNLVSSKYWQTPEFLLLFRNRSPIHPVDIPKVSNKRERRRRRIRKKKKH